MAPRQTALTTIKDTITITELPGSIHTVCRDHAGMRLFYLSCKQEQADHSHSHSHSASRRSDDRRRPRVSGADMDKVYTTIKQVVRDWSAEVWWLVHSRGA